MEQPSLKFLRLSETSYELVLSSFYMSFLSFPTSLQQKTAFEGSANVYHGPTLAYYIRVADS